MKKAILILAALFVVSASSPAIAQDIGAYVGVLGGWVIPPDMSATDTGPAPQTIPDIGLRQGFLLGARAGYIPPALNKWFAAEVEYNYIRNDLNPNAVAVDGKVKIDAVMLNLYARYPQTFIHPYVGVGGGWSWFKLEQYTKNVGGTARVIGDATDNRFCWQLLAGIDFDVAKNVSLGIEYKYFRVKPGLGGPVNLDLDYKANIIDVGVKVLF
jgi:opacity protein-like surface antigen